MQAFATLCAGFLLAVLWFDLMHDVAWRSDLPTVQRYYRRVTTDAYPMNLLVAAVMLGLLATLVAELLGESVSTWAAIVSLVLAVPPILVSRVTVRMAKQLGAAGSTSAGERHQAQLILRQHLFCLVCISAVVTTQLLSLA
jgi:RsiW-degrading membrane proteinase PrsW (M82 family)